MSAQNTIKTVVYYDLKQSKIEKERKIKRWVQSKNNRLREKIFYSKQRRSAIRQFKWEWENEKERILPPNDVIESEENTVDSNFREERSARDRSSIL